MRIFVVNILNRSRPQVDLRFERGASGRTFAARQFVTYPFFLTTPFSLDPTLPGMLTVILQSVSGGIYGHEQLALSLMADAGAQIHYTTQGATVVHSMAADSAASQTVDIFAAAGSFVEYLPDPLILFPEANLRTVVRVAADEDATVILSDAFLAHDPEARARPFQRLFSETSLRRSDGRLLCLDRFTVGGDNAALVSPGVLQHYTAQGTVWTFSSQGGALVAALREALATIPGLYAGASTLPNNAGAWARFLAADAVALQKGLHSAWSAARRTLTGVEPASRRKLGIF